MKSNRIFAGALVCALNFALAGCNSTGSTGASSAAVKLAADINTINAALTSPSAQQAIANARALGMTISCSIAGHAAQAQTLNTALKPYVNSKQAALIANLNNVQAIVYVINASICSQLGGTLGN
jgi:hypothetical protein